MPPPPPSEPKSVPLHHAVSLLSQLQTFLLLTVHSLLYSRGLYPKPTFLTARALNLSVHQSRHPGVCTWVRDAVSNICVQLSKGVVEKVVFVVLGPGEEHSSHGKEVASGRGEGGYAVLERWVVDLSAFPALPEGSWKDGVSASRLDDETFEDEGGNDKPDINWTDVNESLRGALRRLQIAGEKLAPVPEGCTFTMAVELKEDGNAPIGHPQPWIPCQPNQQPTTKTHSMGKTTPIRSVQVGPLFFEMYLEEGKAK